MLLLGVLVSALPAAATAAAQKTRRARRTAAKPAPSPLPTPIVVPQLNRSAARPANTAVAPSQQPPQPGAPAPQTTQPMPTPRPAQTPTPQPATTPAPSEEAIDEDEVVRVTSNLVVVPVSVTDAGGNAVQGLKVGDFKLEEEARAQELSAVGDADQVPLDIAIVFDVSSSVTKNFEFEKKSAAGFLKQVLKPIDRAAVFSITEKPRLEQALASAESATAKLLTIPAPSEKTGTAFYDTVAAAAKYLAANAPERNRRVILVISDGEDNFSDRVRDATGAEVAGGGNLLTAAEKYKALHQRALQEVLREVQRADAVFYSINPSGPGLRLNVISQRAQDQMRLMAETTGGNAFVPEKLESLDAVFRQIAAELRAQYLLQYLSNNDAPKGKFLKIKVLAPARPELRIRARQGYYKKG
ncbi:MAG: VWA domain-containing protein [Acidobacteria bacterium]|nr:VWA domain-containing protein [Acidobacteriota bacterium]